MHKYSFIILSSTSTSTSTVSQTDLNDLVADAMARVDFNTVEKDDNKDLYDSPGNDLHVRSA